MFQTPQFSKGRHALIGLALAALATLSLTPVGALAEKPEIAATGTLKDTGIRHVTAPQASGLLQAHADIVVLDVRTAREFRDGHLEGAVNIDFFAPDFAARLAQLDKSKTYVLHCRSGNRSSKAARLLKDGGAKSVLHLDGGLQAWRAADLPLITEED